VPLPSRCVVLTIRVPAALDRRIARVARQRKATKAAVLREVIEREFGARHLVSADEVRRQSLLVSGTPDAQDVLDFISSVADETGWK
jgi:hypothetical protein